MKVPAFARLPLRFEVGPLLAEVAAIADAQWVAHFNADVHDGGWQGVALRSIEGDPGRLYSDPERNVDLRDTDVLANSAQMVAALRRFECPLRAVRLLRLAPGSVIREHRDDDLRFEEGEARLHVPLATSAEVEFYVDNVRVIMEPGECWYLDLSLPHRVQNRGASERIHLVIDCQVNDWLRAQVAAAIPVERPIRTPSGQNGFEGFRDLVHASPQLQEQLRAVGDPVVFAARVVELGAQNGYSFGEEDVRAAMTRGRQALFSQRIL